MKFSVAKILFLKWLDEKPSSGYELMKRYGEVFGKSSPGTVYPLLKELTNHGLVRKQDKKYEITPKGRQALKNIEKCRKEIITGIKRKLEAIESLLGPYPKPPPKELKPLLAEISVTAAEIGTKAIPVLRKTIKELKSMSESSKT